MERNSSVLYVDQVLINEGEEDIHCVWGEHIALGAPFLDSSCVIYVPDVNILNHPTKMHENSKLEPGLKTKWPYTKLQDGTKHDLSRCLVKNLELMTNPIWKALIKAGMR